MKIRIKFKKYGAMKFIGHLDVMRYFQKAIRRAEVDICYSGGFSPHQVMSFAAPLGVGLTSSGEYMDIEVSQTGDSKTMISRLNQVMSEGFEIISYRMLGDTAGNAMSIVAAADYTVRFRPGYEPGDAGQAKEWFLGLLDFYEQPHVAVTKKTKRGQTQLDIRPLIYDLKLTGTKEDGALFMKISAGSSANIKPELVLDAYFAHLNQERPAFAFLLQREEVYTDQASEDEKEKGHHQFVSLEELGQEL